MCVTNFAILNVTSIRHRQVHLRGANCSLNIAVVPLVVGKEPQEVPQYMYL